MSLIGQTTAAAILSDTSERPSIAVRRHRRHPEEIDEIRRMTDNETKDAISYLKSMKLERPIDPNASPDNSPLSLTKSEVEDQAGGYEIYKEKRRNFQQVNFQLQTLTALVHANENAFTERISKLEAKVDNLMDYMAGPCLRTLLEVTFKRQMGYEDSSDFDFWRELGQTDEKTVLQKTSIELSIWKKMLRFTHDDPVARNKTIHNAMPSHSNLTDCFRKLKESMEDDVKIAFGFLISDSS